MKSCEYCVHREVAGTEMPCKVCAFTTDHPHWQPKDPEFLTLDDLLRGIMKQIKARTDTESKQIRRVYLDLEDGAIHILYKEFRIIKD